MITRQGVRIFHEYVCSPSNPSDFIVVQDLYMSLHAFHLGQIISTVLGQVDHGGQDGNAARTRIRDETPETDHTQK